MPAKKKQAEGNIADAVLTLNAAFSVDAENENVSTQIKAIRDTFVRKLVVELEQDVRKRLNSKLHLAENLILSYKLVEAQKLVKEIHEEGSITAETVYIKGLTEYMIGNLKASIKIFKEALKLDPTLSKATDKLRKANELVELLQCASEEMVCEKNEVVVEILTKALQVDETNRAINQATHFQRSLAYFNLGNPKEAFADYQKFQDMKPLVDSILAASGKDA